MNEKEAVLLKKAINGDIDAFGELICNYEKLIFNISYRKLLNREEAKDAAQESILKIYKNIHKCNNINSFKSWICAITINTCIDELRKRRSDTVYIDEMIEGNDNELAIQIKSSAMTPEEALMKKEMGLALGEAIKELPEDHKDLIILRDVNGMSYQELSDICGISLGTVKSRLSRARANLKKILTSKMEHIHDKTVF